MSFAGKVALVTGGAQGIGRAYTSALLNLGMKVCISDVLEDTAKEFIESLPLAQKENVIFQKCDVTSYTDLKDAFEKAISTFGRLDMMINNAGMFTEENWIKMIEVNFVGVVNGTKLAFEYMDIRKGGKGGHIINTASEAGLDPFYVAPVYCATKHAVVGFSKSYGQDYHFQRTGVTVNAICPGPVDTGFYRAFASRSLDVEEATELIKEMKPVKPEDVAKALLKILEDGKNGTTLRIDCNGLRYV